MTDAPAGTRLRTDQGELSFQEYFVKLRQQPEVREADFSAATASKPAPGVLESITRADAVIVAPSNPILSIGPILAVPGIRDALRNTTATVAAISPIVGGRALKGPAARNMASLGYGASAAAVAELYRDFAKVFVLDEQDAQQREIIAQKEMRAVVTQTVMRSSEDRRELAGGVLKALEGCR